MGQQLDGLGWWGGFGDEVGDVQRGGSADRMGRTAPSLPRTGAGCGHWAWCPPGRNRVDVDRAEGKHLNHAIFGARIVAASESVGARARGPTMWKDRGRSACIDVKITERGSSS